MEKIDKSATQRFGIKVFRKKDEKPAAAVQPKEEKKTDAAKAKTAARSRRRDFE